MALAPFPKSHAVCRHQPDSITAPPNTPLRRASDFHLFFPVEGPRPDRFTINVQLDALSFASESSS